MAWGKSIRNRQRPSRRTRASIHYSQYQLHKSAPSLFTSCTRPQSSPNLPTNLAVHVHIAWPTDWRMNKWSCPKSWLQTVTPGLTKRPLLISRLGHSRILTMITTWSTYIIYTHIHYHQYLKRATIASADAYSLGRPNVVLGCGSLMTSVDKANVSSAKAKSFPNKKGSWCSPCFCKPRHNGWPWGWPKCCHKCSRWNSTCIWFHCIPLWSPHIPQKQSA